ncbi:hypothetical protein APF79_07495 [bacterium BRH_c32]|nr:MAG: hypothetical protein APF79_07495 [bacterium BRH_c32]
MNKNNSYKIFFFGISIILQFIIVSFPLTNTLHFEFSAINSIIIFFFSALYTIKYFRKTGIIDFLKNNYPVLLLIIFLPFVIGVFSTIFLSECPFGEGVFFYLVISVPNLLFGITFGMYISLFYKSYKATLILLVITLLLLISPLIEIYFNPGFKFYNLIFGYFPGTIYDENISIDSRLLLFRFLNVVLFSSALFIYKYILNYRNAKIYLITFCIVIFTLNIPIKGLLGLSITKSVLNNHFSLVKQTEHFNIYYEGNENEFDSLYLPLLHEYYYSEIKQELGIEEKIKIDSYIFENDIEKGEFIGSINADIAKPWQKQIYITKQSIDRTLKHELVHAISYSIGNSFLKLPYQLNPALLEGLATAIENDFAGVPIHYAAYHIIKSYPIKIEDLFSGFSFFGNYSSISYVVSGSFLKYILEKYGNEKLLMLYKSGAFKEIYKKKISQLGEEYIEYLDNLGYGYDKNYSLLYFGGQTIFKKICPRFAAKEFERGIKFFQSKDFDSASDIFRKLYDRTNNYSYLNYYINSLVYNKRIEEAHKFFLSQERYLLGSRYQFNYWLKNAELYGLEGKLDSTFINLNKLIENSPSINYSTYASTVLYLLKSDPDSFKKFYFSKSDEKIKLLISNQNTEIRADVVIEIIDLADNRKEYSDEIENIIKIIDFKNNYLGYSFLKVSKYFFNIGEINKAEFYSTESLRLNKNSFFNYEIEENNKMVLAINEKMKLN